MHDIHRVTYATASLRLLFQSTRSPCPRKARVPAVSSATITTCGRRSRGQVQSEKALMKHSADTPSKSPEAPARAKQPFKRGPRPEPAKPNTHDPERDRYGSRGQQTDIAGRERRELPNDDDYGDFLRDDEPRDESTRRDK